MEFVEKTGKTVDEAVTEALIELGTTSENVEIEIVEKGSSGLFGLFNKPAVVRVKKKMNYEGIVTNFLENVFSKMNLVVDINIKYSEKDALMDIDLKGPNMGVLIGKRGQTLDSIQYLTSLVLNKESNTFIKVKLDTENYRVRRKETLENLAKNIALKVKKTNRKVSLEPMNPYERRIIHSALQNDKFVVTHSEGEEPYRKVIVAPKKI
ncbi:spoIIIJ-associated protein [Natranaerovirga pectinivora]|uniref:RNA-binding protein KhpB n=1 Tax=Natranaerovirga pectinivora TaxID=682400 RepID=A0A4V2UZR0_9FIRM|nr:RNA-binding cell elongation regulator Jag/EloR [Natranaerovirga pectinivora]TCT12245.1 spoIIIJ-associated protein [Natranaerovirga pectinivora]